MSTIRVRARADIVHDRDVDPETGVAVTTTVPAGTVWDCPEAFAAQLLASGAVERAATSRLTRTRRRK